MFKISGSDEFFIDKNFEEETVIYRALYDEKKLWVRPKSIFLETLTIGKKEIFRFKYLMW